MKRFRPAGCAGEQRVDPRQTRFADMTPEEWREIMGTTIDGAFYCAMRRRLTSRGRRRNDHQSWRHFLACRCGRAGARDDGEGWNGRADAGVGEGTGGGQDTVNTVVPGSIETVRGSAAEEPRTGRRCRQPGWAPGQAG